MKTIITFVISFLFLFVFSFHSNAITNNERVTVEINLAGNMLCKMSSSIIKKSLHKVDGVKKIDIDVNAKTVTIDYDDSKTNLTALEKALTKAGFNANDKEADMAGYDSLPKCCKAH